MGQYPLPEWFCVCICRWPSVCGQRRSAQHRRIASLPYFLRQGLSLNLEPSGFLRLVGQQVPGYLSSLTPQLLDYRYASPIQLLLCGCLGLNLIPYVYMRNTLLIELSSQQLQFSFFFKLFSLASTTCYITRNEDFGCPYVLSRMSQWVITSTNDHAHSHENIFYCCFSS